MEINLVKIVGYKNIVNSIRNNLSLLPGALGKDPFPLKHSFADGLYVREIFIPKGYFCVGACHHDSYVNFIVSGDMSVMTEEGIKRVVGPQMIISPAGAHRIGYSHEDTVWVTVHKNPANERDLDVLDKLIHYDDYVKPEEITNEAFDAKRFRELTEKIYSSEKPGFWSEWTTEQREKYMSGDWEAFSRSRGYNENEISELREWIAMKEDGDARGCNPLALVSDLVYACAIRNLLTDKNGEAMLSSHMPTSKKVPYMKNNCLVLALTEKGRDASCLMGFLRNDGLLPLNESIQTLKKNGISIEDIFVEECEDGTFHANTQGGMIINASEFPDDALVGTGVVTAIYVAAAVAAVGIGVSVQQSNMQQKSAKSAAEAAQDQQNRLLKEAENKAAGEESTMTSAIGRARQKALAAATASSGRASTIKTGSQGLIGSAPGEAKSLIGE